MKAHFKFIALVYTRRSASIAKAWGMCSGGWD
jgi:hypothetical protein